MTCFGSCGYWRRRQLLAQHHHMGTAQHHPGAVQQPYSMHYTAASAPYPRPIRCQNATMGLPVYPNYGYPVVPEALPQAQGMFPAPPPYAEVSNNIVSYSRSTTCYFLVAFLVKLLVSSIYVYHTIGFPYTYTYTVFVISNLQDIYGICCKFLPNIQGMYSNSYYCPLRCVNGFCQLPFMFIDYLLPQG